MVDAPVAAPTDVPEFKPKRLIGIYNLIEKLTGSELNVFVPQLG